MAVAAFGVAALGTGTDRIPPGFAVGTDAIDATTDAGTTPFGALILAVVADFVVGGEFGVVPVVGVGGASAVGGAGVIEANAAGFAPTGVAIDAEAEGVVVVGDAAVAAIGEPLAVTGGIQPSAGAATGAAVEVGSDEAFLSRCGFGEKCEGAEDKGEEDSGFDQFHERKLLRERKRRSIGMDRGGGSR